jgi:hypothetical protein
MERYYGGKTSANEGNDCYTLKNGSPKDQTYQSMEAERRQNVAQGNTAVMTDEELMGYVMQANMEAMSEEFVGTK